MEPAAVRKFLICVILAFGTEVLLVCQNPAGSAQQLYSESQAALDEGDFTRSKIALQSILMGGYQLSDYNWAIIHNTLGLVNYEMGNYRAALHHYRDAESFSSGKDLGSVRVQNSIHNNLAMYYNGLGDYTNALAHYDKAIRLLNSVPSNNRTFYSRLSMHLFNKGIVFYRLKRYEDALEILKQSEQIKQVHDLTYLGSVFFNLARVYQMLGKSNLSGQYYRKSIDQWESEYGAGYYQLASIHLHYGQFLVQQGDFDQGFKFFQEALQNNLSNFGVKHPLTSGCYEQIARSYVEQLEFGKALKFCQLALISVSESFNDETIYSNPEDGTSLHDLYLLKAYATKVNALEGLAGSEELGSTKLEILKAALATNGRSIEVLHRLRGSYLSGESRIYLSSGQKELFHSGIRLNLTMFQCTQKEKYKEQAFLWAAQSKTNDLLYVMKEKEWLYLESLHDSLALDAIDMKRQIDHYSNRIQLENLKVRPDSVKIVDWAEQLFNSRDTFSRQMEQLSQEYPQIGHFESIDAEFSVEQISQQLGRKENLVEYFISNKEHGSRNLFVFVVNRNGCHVHQDQIDSTFDGNLKIVLRNLHEFHPFRESLESYDSLKSALYKTYQKFVQPVESLFHGKNLVIVPDEELAYLPFDALLNHYTPETILNYAGLPYLMNIYDITYLYNSRLFKKVWSPTLQLPRLTALVPEYTAFGNADSLRLKGANEEVRQIFELVKGRNTRGDPDKTEVKRILEEGEIIHLAMHARSGKSTKGSPYFLLDANEDTLFNNRLYDYEINGLNISSPMVVLSSCRTGGGQLHSGEGIISLSRSFLLAGAKSVVHTLWPVEDTRGPDLMLEYYHELKRGRSKSSSLTVAKQNYLESTPPSYTHPYYWASYQITGNPVPLCKSWRYLFFPGLILVISLTALYFIRRSLRARS